MKKNTKLFSILSFLGIILGSQLGLYLFGKGSGSYDTGLILPNLIGSLIGCGGVCIFSFLKKRKNGNVPEFDERSIHIIKSISYNILFIALSITSVIVVVLYSIGVHTISTLAVASYLTLIYIIIGIGLLIAKYRF